MDTNAEYFVGLKLLTRRWGGKFHEPRLRFAGKITRPATPSKSDGTGVKGLIFKNQLSFLVCREPVLNQRQITILVPAVKFVADDRMAKVSQMDTNLVFASGLRPQTQKRKGQFFPVPVRDSPDFPVGRKAMKPFQDDKIRPRRRAVGPDTILDRDAAAFVPAERSLNHSRLRRHMAVDNGEIFFFHGTVFENFAQFTGSPGIFGNQHHAAGFTVKPIDQMASKR